MFDFAWSEIALIGVVALIAIGPKDMPVAIKTIAELIKKARRMAGEFQTHVDEMVREANLHDVRDQFNDLRRMDIKGKILNAVDGDGTLRKTMADNPMDFSPPPPVVPVADSVPATALPDTSQHDASLPDTSLPHTVVAERELHSIPGLEQAPLVPLPQAPAFVPPAYVPAAVEPPPVPPHAAAEPAAPAFVPPDAAAANASTQHA